MKARKWVTVAATLALVAAGTSAQVGARLGRVHILVEMRFKNGESESTTIQKAANLVTGFTPDHQFGAVLMEPSPYQLELGLGPNERTRVVRGELQPGSPAFDQALPPAIVRIWRDVLIQPLGDCPVDPTACIGNDFPCSNVDTGVTAGSIQAWRAANGVTALWEGGINGDGVVIGIVDGGILEAGFEPFLTANYPEVGPNPVVGGWPPAGGVPKWGDQKDWGDHGHMTALGALLQAPGAKIYDIRISEPGVFLGCPGGLLSTALKAFEWAIQEHAATGAPHMLSNSWGLFFAKAAKDYISDPAHPFNRKVRAAVNSGILVTFAAGNGGTDPCFACSVQAPQLPILGANGHPFVMSVAAVSVDDEYALFSSFGPALLGGPQPAGNGLKPDFAAPTTYNGYYEKIVGGGGPPDTGTSAACAVAAGVVALMMDAYEQQEGVWPTPQAVKDALRLTALQLDPDAIATSGGYTYSKYVGAGVLQPFFAVAEVLP